MCKKMLSPADDAGSRVPPCAAGYLQINLSDPLGESVMEDTWKLVKCHRHCDPQPGHHPNVDDLDPSPARIHLRSVLCGPCPSLG